MKQAGDDNATNRGFDVLERLIANAPSEADQPVEWMDRCHDCRDTGFVLSIRDSNVSGPGVYYARNCGCGTGQSRVVAFPVDTDADRREFLDLMRRLCTLFGKPFSYDLSAAYWENLRQHPMRDIRRGMEKATARCKFFPKVAEILEGIHG